jgi:hypothetical protein
MALAGTQWASGFIGGIIKVPVCRESVQTESESDRAVFSGNVDNNVLWPGCHYACEMSRKNRSVAPASRFS